MSNADLKQVKIVESEKGVHLTYFLNGRKQEPFPNEERIIVESAKRNEDNNYCRLGRKWAMDRENNWDRVEKAYRLFVYGEGEKAFLK